MFFKKPLFLEIFLLAIVIAVMHFGALVFFLYWTTEWFDVIMHFLGGMLMGLGALFIFYTSGFIKLPTDNRLLVFVITLSFVLVIGLAWELWEIFVGFTDVLEDQADTILDVIMDTLGALAAIWYFRAKLARRALVAGDSTIQS